MFQVLKEWKHFVELLIIRFLILFKHDLTSSLDCLQYIYKVDIVKP